MSNLFILLCFPGPSSTIKIVAFVYFGHGLRLLRRALGFHRGIPPGFPPWGWRSRSVGFGVSRCAMGAPRDQNGFLLFRRESLPVFVRGGPFRGLSQARRRPSGTFIHNIPDN